MPTNPTLDAAIMYHHFGWSVIPTKPMSKAASVRWIPYQTKLATVGELTHWLVKWPLSGLAVITGQLSGICVLDVDGRIERSYLAALATIETPRVETARGFHFYFAYPRFQVVNRTIGQNLEFKANNALSQLPPSVHPSGKVYRWVIPPIICPAAQLPSWIAELARPAKLQPATGPKLVAPGMIADHIQRYANSALNRSLSKVHGALEGERNDTLNNAALSLGELVGAGVLSKSLVESALLGAAMQSGLTEYEARRTIRSAITKGMLSPRDLTQIKPIKR